MKSCLSFICVLVLAFCGSLQASDSIQNVDKIVSCEQGVFLLLDGVWIRVDRMQATTEGILVFEEGEWTPLNEEIICGSRLWWKCPNPTCGKYNPQNVRYCVYCGRDRFK